MNSAEIYKKLKEKGISEEEEQIILHEINFVPSKEDILKNDFKKYNDLYYENDFEKILQMKLPKITPLLALQTLDELIDRDKQREKDGFPRRIRLGKLIKPTKDGKGQVIIVPSTTEPKFYHDNRISENPQDMGETGGTGEEGEGEILGEQKVNPQQGEGEGSGAGEGGEESHDIAQEAFDLGKVLTEKFELPNLKDKGNKRSLVKYHYDLTDKNKGFGQLLDKKATLKKIIETNIQLGRVDDIDNIKPDNFIINPNDKIFSVLSKEKSFESQALVFFVRDYSGSMQGAPTEVVTSQHLMIYSWLMYQYQNRVETRYILHDTNAKEVPDFYTYYRSQVAGGTQVAPAIELINSIIETENLYKNYNIYVFYGTDGDDWESNGEKMIEATNKLLTYVNRFGITIAKNSWTTATQTTIEKYLVKSGLLSEKPNLIKLDSFPSTDVNENRIIEGIKKLTE
jgi:uncharacterized sporulation protein YeaH/YhbH (DUF444 family)